MLSISNIPRLYSIKTVKSTSETLCHGEFNKLLRKNMSNFINKFMANIKFRDNSF